jgi:hypothetical protein
MGINKVTYTTEDGQEIDILHDKVKEAEEGMAYFVNENLFNFVPPVKSPEKRLSLFRRIRRFIATKLLDMAESVDSDTYYGHFSDY